MATEILILRSATNTPTVLKYGAPAVSFIGGRAKFYLGDPNDVAFEITDALNIKNVPSGAVLSEDVQGAIDELESIASDALDAAEHRVIDQLIHNIAETSVEEVISNNGLITSHTWYTDGTKTIKIRDIVNLYANGIVTQETHTQYDDLGVAIVGEKLVKIFTVINGVITLSTNTLS